MAYAGGGRQGAEQQFFSPMGAGVGAVFNGPGAAKAASPAPPPPLRVPPPGPLAGAAAGTPTKLAAQDLYWRWFQMADSGGCSAAPPLPCALSDPPSVWGLR